MKKIYVMIFFLLLGKTYLSAQDIRITGRVTDTKNEPLASVSINVSGTNNGTTTNADGSFSISASSNAVLVFSYIGYASQTINVSGRSTINVSLSAESKDLETVVVTALGIQRSAKGLTYATTNLSSEELNEVKGPNVLNSLAGKAAGVFVTQGSGGPGSSPRIILRGNKSINGNNQPLYVVDGIPIGGFSDFNSEDIESMQILQGASAAALYGSQAANGVILITTKKGKLGTTTVNFASTATFDNPMILPEVQTNYGQGNKGASITTINDSWGPKISNGSDAHIRDFFRTGENYLNSLSISSGNETQRVYLSYANTAAKSMLPNYDFKRHNLTLRGSTQLFQNKVTVDGAINYIKSNADNQNASQWYNSPMFGLYLFPTGDDFSKYGKDNYQVWSDTRNMFVQNWPYIKNEHSSNQNPYWIQNRIQRNNLNDRTNFNLSVKWNINDWLNVAARSTFNRYQNDNEGRFAATSDPTSVGANGAYTKNVSSGEQLYSDILLTGTKSLSKNLSLNAVVGASNTVNSDRSVYAGTDGAQTTLAYPNYFSIYGLTGNFVSTESNTKTISRAVFGSATLGFKETVYLDVTARNEWSSTVNQPFFYPSVGLAYILTNTIGSNDIFSFAKIRGSYAEVGSGLAFGASERNPNYSLSPTENINGRGALPFFSGKDTINLKPERTRSYEVGAELRFFKDKLSLNVTYYNATTYDQVFQIGAPAGSGASNFWINGGTILNKGIEAALSYHANLGKITWTPGINFSTNKNEIRELSSLLTSDRFVLQNGNRLTNLFLLRPGSELLGDRKYGSYHDLFGRTYQYEKDGRQMFDATTGLPMLSKNNDQYLGNANPDFLLNFSNHFKYKNFSFSFLLDGRFGGLVSSSTEQWLDFKGLSKRSGIARDNGGVMVNGQLMDAEKYYTFISGNADIAAATQEYVFSSTNIRLRELAFGYTLPKFSNTFKNVNLSLVARNVCFLYKKAPFDPELALSTSNGGQGFEAFQIPSATSWGLTLRVGL